MAKKDIYNLKSDLLAVKAEAINVYNSVIAKEIDLVTSVNQGNFDTLFHLFSKDELVELSKQAQSAHNSWFFSTVQTKMFEDNLESSITNKLTIAPKFIAQNVINEVSVKLQDYFDLDSFGMIKYEDLQAHKDAFSVFNDLENIKGSGSVKNHTMVIDHTMIDGSDTHLEAKFDPEKFGEWIQYNLVEEHYIEHMEA
ncbi:MAG: hypothetical protein ACK5WS_03545 [Alphaproteobacteria bacterium]|jgi:hypothetical protein|nr:hypothetical protein [Candidatus Jidaibacter sp.]